MFQAWCPCLPHLSFGFHRPSSSESKTETTAEPISNGPSSSYGTVPIAEINLNGPDTNGKTNREWDGDSRTRCLSSSSDCVDSGSEKGTYHSPVKKRLSGDSVSSRGRRCSELTSIGEILPDLYQRTGSIFTQSGSRRGSGVGKIRFRLSYNFNKSDFVVNIVEVLTLNSTSDNDMFVTIFLKPQLDGKQRQSKTSKAAQINEVFKFPCVMDDLQGRSLHIEVWSQGVLVRKSLVGAVDFDLADVDVSTEVEIVADLEKDKQEPHNGRLLVSLAYLPAAERLTVTIGEAKDLKFLSDNRHLDVFVKVNICHAGKKIKKRRTGGRRNCGNPAWNEQLSFDVPHDLIRQLSVDIQVADGSGVIGQLLIGPVGTSREAKQQWDEMVEAKVSHSVWHRLALPTTEQIPTK